MSATHIGELEQHVLAGIIVNSECASGYVLRECASQSLGRKVTTGVLYATLDRLLSKGLVTYVVGEGSIDRGGRPQRFFSITGEGRTALSDALSGHQRLARLVAQ